MTASVYAINSDHLSTASSEFSVSLKEVMSKKFMPFSQKAAILKLLEADENCDGEICEAELIKGKEILKSLRDSICNALANVAVVSALIGVTTFTFVLQPLEPAFVDGPEEEPSEALARAYTVCNVISTGMAMIAIALCTFYNLVITTLLTNDEDFGNASSFTSPTLTSVMYCPYSLSTSQYGSLCTYQRLLLLSHSALLEFCLPLER